MDVAVQEWEVDIISISFGWSETAAQDFRKHSKYHLYQSAIERASGQALVFAAATNDGPNVGRAWPARENGIFCVHSTDGKGAWSEHLNPQKMDPKESLNLAMLGEAVESYWPGQLMAKKTTSGTSYAAPFAASIAAFLLMFVQKYLGDNEATKLKHFLYMKNLMQTICTESIAKGHMGPKDFHYLHLSLESDNLFGKSDETRLNAIKGALKGTG